MTEQILIGNKCVVIDYDPETLYVSARLYVNARNNLAFNGTATTIRWKGATVEGARNWAHRQLGAQNNTKIPTEWLEPARRQRENDYTTPQ